MLYGNITDVPGIKVGVVTDLKAATGCSVLTVEKGATGGVSVKGGAPGTKETDLLRSSSRVEEVHAIALSGGSAFGLDTATGVMRYLEERGVGLEVAPYRIPIVPAAIIFDLFIGDGSIRPDASWGYKAASKAQAGHFPEGSAGAGTGATVGNIFGMEFSIKCGQASLSYKLPDGLIIGVLVVVNALGDIIGEDGSLLAGARHPERGHMIGALETFKSDGMRQNHDRGVFYRPNVENLNTTIGIVATNGKFSKVEVNRLASLAHNGLARAISPLHTGWDGDTIFALATGEKESPVDIVGALGAELMENSVREALKKSTSLAGVPTPSDIK